MKLINLIKTNNWLSLQNTFLSLYPDEEHLLDEYKNVFEKLHSLEFIDMDLEIVLTKIGSEESDFYIDVSGSEINHDQNSSSDSYSLASTKWNEWLGMNISQSTLNEFNELGNIQYVTEFPGNGNISMQQNLYYGNYNNNVSIQQQQQQILLQQQQQQQQNHL